MSILRLLGLSSVLAAALLSSAAVAEPRREPVRVEPRREVVRVEPRRDVVRVEPRVEPRREVVVEPRRDVVRIEPRRDGWRAEPRRAVFVQREVVLRNQYRVRVNEYRVQRAEWRRDPVVWRDRRPYRAWDRRVELSRTWGVVVLQPDAQIELSLHAERMARLNRVLDIYEDSHDDAMVVQTHALIDVETDRNVGVMVGFQAQVEVP